MEEASREGEEEEEMRRAGAAGREGGGRGREGRVQVWEYACGGRQGRKELAMMMMMMMTGKEAISGDVDDSEGSN